MKASDLGKGAEIILAAVTVRFFVVVLITHSPKYNFKERLFMGCCWLAKATVQAALSGIMLSEVKEQPSNPNYSQYYEYANVNQTIAIFSIIICASIGSISLNSLGPILLRKQELELDSKIKDSNETKITPNKVVPARSRSNSYHSRNEVAAS